MHPYFSELMCIVAEKFRQLVASEPMTYPLGGQLRASGGIYVFYENEQPIYVGRTNKLRTRLGEHQQNTATYDQAPLASWLAKKECGRKRTYHIKRSDPEHISRDETFLAAFATAKERIRAMQIRVIEETDPTRQALLEIYTATLLKTEANEFDNH